LNHLEKIIRVYFQKGCHKKLFVKKYLVVIIVRSVEPADLRNLIILYKECKLAADIGVIRHQATCQPVVSQADLVYKVFIEMQHSGMHL
jgi:hypothetical protein